MHFTYTLFTDILFIKSSRNTLQIFLKTPNSGHKMCEETVRNMWSCVFMPPPLGAGGIMFSGCPSVCPSVRPSVRSLKYPLLTCTWVRWSTRPTVTVLRHVRPSVRLSVRPSVRPSGEVSGHLPENAWREWPEILHADVSWLSSELISLWLRSDKFSNFGAILT